MDVSEEREDGVSASDVTLSEQHDSQTRDKSPVKQKRPPDKHVPSCVSMKSGRSIDEPIEFKDGDHSDNQIKVNEEGPDSPALSCLSWRSGQSIGEPICFKDGGQADNQIQVKQERPDSPALSCLSWRSGQSIDEPLCFKDGRQADNQIAHRKRSEVLSICPVQKHQQNLDSIFMFFSEHLEGLNEAEVMEGEEEEQRSSNRDAFMKLTLNFLRNMKQEQLADSLQSNFCELSLDPDTAHRNLFVSDSNRRVMVVKEKQPYPDHRERFDSWKQLLCGEGLNGRCYWEAQCKGMVHVGVTYRGINRKGDSDVCCIGWDDQSWSLLCTAKSYTAWHNNTPTDIATLPPSDSYRIPLLNKDTKVNKRDSLKTESVQDVCFLSLKT